MIDWVVVFFTFAPGNAYFKFDIPTVLNQEIAERKTGYDRSRPLEKLMWLLRHIVSDLSRCRSSRSAAIGKGKSPISWPHDMSYVLYAFKGFVATLKADRRAVENSSAIYQEPRETVEDMSIWYLSFVCTSDDETIAQHADLRRFLVT